MKRQSAPFPKSKLDELAEEILPDEIHEIWTEYVQMRNRVAKSRIETDNSQKRIFRQLLNFSMDNDKRYFSLEQSTDFKWRGFFEPQNDYLMQYRKRKGKREPLESSFPTLSDPVKKFDKRAILQKQADAGSAMAKLLLTRLNNPNIAKAETAREVLAREEAIKEKMRKDKKVKGFTPLSK